MGNSPLLTLLEMGCSMGNSPLLTLLEM